MFCSKFLPTSSALMVGRYGRRARRSPIVEVCASPTLKTLFAARGSVTAHVIAAATFNMAVSPPPVRLTAEPVHAGKISVLVRSIHLRQPKNRTWEITATEDGTLHEDLVVPVIEFCVDAADLRYGNSRSRTGEFSVRGVGSRGPDSVAANRPYAL
jgi:hypothetical protein